MRPRLILALYFFVNYPSKKLYFVASVYNENSITYAVTYFQHFPGKDLNKIPAIIILVRQIHYYNFNCLLNSFWYNSWTTSRKNVSLELIIGELCTFFGAVCFYFICVHVKNTNLIRSIIIQKCTYLGKDFLIKIKCFA